MTGNRTSWAELSTWFIGRAPAFRNGSSFSCLLRLEISEVLMCLEDMGHHSLTVKGQVEAVSHSTEHRQPEVKPDVVVECLVT